MDNNRKPWYEKISIWFSIIASFCTILGISVFGGKALLEGNDDSNQASSMMNSSDVHENQDEVDVDDGKVKISEMHTPNDAVTNVSIVSWDSESDIDINGIMYDGGLKVTMSNMFTSMGSGVSNNIISRITIPLSDTQKNAEEKAFLGTFVLDQTMFGSKSSGVIKIIINNQEVFSTGEIDGNTKESFPFNVSYEGADVIMIEANVNLRSSEFTFGIVNSK